MWTPGCHWGGNRTNLFTCACDFEQKKTLSGLLWQEETKAILANKDNSYSIVYMYSLLCSFVQQYSNNVDFMSMGEAQMGVEVGLGANPRFETKAPLASWWSCH